MRRTDTAHGDRWRTWRATGAALVTTGTLIAGMAVLAATEPAAPPASAGPYIPCEQWQQMHPGWPCVDVPEPSQPPTAPTPPPLPSWAPNQPGTGGGTRAGALTPPPVGPGNGTPIVPVPGRQAPQPQPAPPPPAPAPGAVTVPGRTPVDLDFPPKIPGIPKLPGFPRPNVPMPELPEKLPFPSLGDLDPWKQLPNGTWLLDPKTSDYVWQMAKWGVPAIATVLCTEEFSAVGLLCALPAYAVVQAIDSYKVKPMGPFQIKITISDSKFLGIVVGKNIQVEILPVTPTSPPAPAPTSAPRSSGVGPTASVAPTANSPAPATPPPTQAPSSRVPAPAPAPVPPPSSPPPPPPTSPRPTPPPSVLI